MQRAGVDISRYRPEGTLEHRIAALAQRLEINLFLDVGANTGFYAERIRMAGYMGRIHSFEPLSGEFALLKARAAGDHQWACDRCAVGKETAQATINIAGNSQSSSLLPMETLHVAALPSSGYVGTEVVDVRRLDDLVTLNANDRLFLKIDVQGFEEQVLDGCERLMDRVIMCQIELSPAPVYTGAPNWRALLDRVSLQGFDLFLLVPAFEHPLTGQTLQLDAVMVKGTGSS